MASLQLRNGSWRILFNYKNKQLTFTVGEVEEIEARAVKGKVEYLLLRLKQRLAHSVPPDDRIVEYLQNDGTLPGEGILTKTLPEKKPLTLIVLRDEYLTLHAKLLDPRTVKDMKGHWKHLGRLLGEFKIAGELVLADLQNYVMKRVGEGVEGATAKKEIVTLRTVWNWAVRMDMLKSPFPNKGLRFPKGEEKPPFMTFAEVKRRVAAGASGDLWESVFLTRPEIEQLLKSVEEKAAYPWVAPMFWFAAHTGARRSELLRVQNDDIDLHAGTALIREKKRRRDVRESTRRVPLSDALKERLRKWLAVHPGGPYLFCHSGVVLRSRKRSARTGYKGNKTRPSTAKDRLVGVTDRPVQPPASLAARRPATISTTRSQVRNGNG